MEQVGLHPEEKYIMIKLRKKMMNMRFFVRHHIWGTPYGLEISGSSKNPIIIHIFAQLNLIAVLPKIKLTD